MQEVATVKGVRESAFMSGDPPSISGIVGNDWFDRDTGKSDTSVSDEAVKILGGSGEGGAPPHPLLLSTVGDQLKISDSGKPRFIRISMEHPRRSRPSAHMAQPAVLLPHKHATV